LRLPGPSTAGKPDGAIRIELTAYDPVQGFVGQVIDEQRGVRLEFESNQKQGYLESIIRRPDGTAVIEYDEAEQVRVYHPNPAVQIWEPNPSLRISGIRYRLLQGPVVPAMRKVARSADGDLIRYLAHALIFYAPGEDLTAERRGLELPYQAMQTRYDTPFVFSPTEMLAFARSLPVRTVASGRGGAASIDLGLSPVGCDLPDCKIVSTADYAVVNGGFHIFTQPIRLMLTHNHEPTARPWERR
jgi:hypothetical protein